MSKRRAALWTMLALVGIVVPVGLTWSMMRLAGQHIGLASAPISVVHGLAPGPGARASAPPEHDATRTETVTVTVSRTVTAPGQPAGTTRTTTRSAQTTTAPAITITPPRSAGGSSSRSSDDGRDASRHSQSSGRDD